METELASYIPPFRIWSSLFQRMIKVTDGIAYIEDELYIGDDYNYDIKKHKTKTKVLPKMSSKRTFRQGLWI